MLENNNDDFKKITKWFYENKKYIIKKASYPCYVPVSNQIAKYKHDNELKTGYTSKQLARLLTWDI